MTHVLRTFYECTNLPATQRGLNYSLPYGKVCQFFVRSATDRQGVALRKGTETILVVDDEEMIKDLARDILARYGYTVLTAGGGEEAMEIYRQHKQVIAVVVLDLVLPDVGGREVFRRIREIDPAAQVIISSGYNQERDATDLLKEGAVKFVQKPYRIASLVGAVGEVLEKGKGLRR
jgi:two-component system, cell cycle sensor histidine kinase and response regulator CckA